MRRRGPAMHPELRLIEDFMTDRGVLNLPALPRMLYIVRGSITSGRRTVRMGETLYSEEAITAHAEGVGATLWRWELSDPRQPVAKMASPSVYSRDKLAQPLATLPQGDLLWRGDSVAFPPGGCAYLHRHQGPGIRCVVDGELRVDTGGQSHTHRVGDAWYEAGPDPVFAQAGAMATRFIRVMILPRALIGKSSIQYVNAEDKDKPKSQQYRVFVDAPLSWG
jgi:quercetin dioxygenase-like cupin family protein